MTDKGHLALKKFGPFTVQYRNENRLILHRMSPLLTNGLILASIFAGIYFSIINYRADHEGIVTAIGSPAYAPLFVTILIMLCLWSACGFTLEVDKKTRTLTYQKIRPYEISRVTRSIDEITAISPQKGRFGVYWGGSIEFEDDSWPLWGGGIWSWPISFQPSPEIIRLLREECQLEGP